MFQWEGFLLKNVQVVRNVMQNTRDVMDGAIVETEATNQVNQPIF